LNAVVKWVKRKPAWLNFKAIPQPARLLVIADAAFRREDTTGLAMRGYLLCLAGPAVDANNLTFTGDAAPESTQVQILEWASRRQKRVVRSTFAAELNSMADAIEGGKLLNLALTEISFPRWSMTQLATALEQGKLLLRLDVFTDCRSIFDAMLPEELRLPTESGLFALLLIVRELMTCGLIDRMYWIDTRDMLADGLNKGSVARTQLLAVAREGAWYPKLPLKMFQEAVKVPVVTSPEFARSRATAGSTQSFSVFSLLDYEYVTALLETKMQYELPTTPCRLSSA
jgi:hypothetical protein